MSYPPPQGYGAAPTAPPEPPSPPNQTAGIVLLILALGVGIIAAVLAVPSRTPPAAATPATSAATLTPAPEPEPEPVPQRQSPPRRVTNDAMIAGRIGGMEGAERDAALCAFIEQADPTISAGLLDRNPARFFGHLWAFDGDVIQIEDVPGESGSFLLLMLNDEANSTVAVTTYLRPDDSVVTGHRVRVYGRVAGTFTYETRAGTESTVPKVLGTAVILRREAPRCRRR